MRSISSSISRCWPVTQVMTLNRSGSFSSALMTGAILIASGRVPNTTRIFLDASAVIALTYFRTTERTAEEIPGPKLACCRMWSQCSRNQRIVCWIPSSKRVEGS